MPKLIKIFAACYLCLLASLGWANSAPTNITASNLTITENSAIGTVIGEFNATDPDGDTNITYSMVLPLPGDLNISLWLDASDVSAITHSNGSVSQWDDISGNNRNAIQTETTKRPFINQSSKSIIFDGRDDLMPINGFNPQGEFSIYAVFANTRETLPSSGDKVDVVLATGPAGGAGFTLETYNTWGTRSTRRLYLYGQGTSGLTFVNGTRTTTEESKK